MLAAVLSGYGVSLAAPWLQRAGRNATGWLLALLPFGLFVYFASLLGVVIAGNVVTVSYPWIPSLGVNLSFRVDGLSLLFSLLITGIGTLVFIYAGGYMVGDAMVGRLYAFLMMFMTSMIGLVLSDNLLALFVFWELTTVSSYLLIGYKHKYEKARKAALQGLLVTGSGGLALLAGVALLNQASGSFEFSVLLGQAPQIKASPLYPAIVALVLLGAFTKSAQFPFHFWLPGAMEAPTPVSSYLHSATMVKAGVFLLARMTPVLGGTALWQTTLTGFGLATLLVGYGLAVLQTDLKRILAYTTIAALGTLVMTLGIGAEDAIKATVVFLLGHALYKGALFMVAGSVDHETGTRDIRQLGGLRAAMPITAAAASLAAISFAGLPPLFGFIGKELVYKAALGQSLVVGLAVVANVLAVVAAGFVSAQVFFGKPAGHTPKHPHEAPLSMWLGPVVLAGISLAIGLLPWLVDGLASAAAGAVYGKPKVVELKLWPGIDGANGIALLLSGITIALGLGLYMARQVFLRLGEAARGTRVWGPERLYYASLDGMLAVARWQTSLLQNGYLRYYISMIIVTGVGLAGYALMRPFFAGAQFALPQLTEVRIYEAILALVMVAATVVVLRATSRLVAIIALGVVGYGMALVFLLYGGPDLAMTQFAIETLSAVLFVLVLYRLPRFNPRSTVLGRTRDAAVAVLAGALMTTVVLIVLGAPAASRLTPYFAENSSALANGLNVVNVIIVDFRGFDTMGEITVLGLAAIGIYALIRMRPVDEPADSKSDIEMARLTAKTRPASEAALPPGEEQVDVEHMPCEPADVPVVRIAAPPTNGIEEDQAVLAALLKVNDRND
jgi:multicomponent Na+:H+ antiporter subunit A